MGCKSHAWGHSSSLLMSKRHEVVYIIWCEYIRADMPIFSEATDVVQASARTIRKACCRDSTWCTSRSYNILQTLILCSGEYRYLTLQSKIETSFAFTKICREFHRVITSMISYFFDVIFVKMLFFLSQTCHLNATVSPVCELRRDSRRWLSRAERFYGSSQPTLEYESLQL